MKRPHERMRRDFIKDAGSGGTTDAAILQATLQL